MILSNAEGLAGCDLLRGLVFREKPNSEIEASLAAVSKGPGDFQELALELTGLTVPEEIARVTLSALVGHVRDLSDILKRPIGIRTAALDLLDRTECRRREEGGPQAPPHESLERLAFVDYLTGLPNFRSLSERFDNEIKRATRYRRLLSLVMFDLDGFKEINDRFGHLVGNAALKHVAGLVRGFVRETDVVGRFGGNPEMLGAGVCRGREGGLTGSLRCVVGGRGVGVCRGLAEIGGGIGDETGLRKAGGDE